MMIDMSIEIMGFIVGAAVISGLLGFFIQRSISSRYFSELEAGFKQHIAELQKELAVDQHTINTLETTNERIHDELENQKSLSSQQQTQLSERSASISSLRSSLEGLSKQGDDYKIRLIQLEELLEEQRIKTETVTQEKSALVADMAELQSSLKERDESHQRELARFQEQKDELKKDFENLANQILDVKGKSFAEESQKSLTSLLTPFREQVKSFQDKVENIHHQETQQQAAMKNELLQLQKMQVQMSEEASRLSTALQGQKKIQGNWGELVLENVLDNSGLRAGKDYRREVTFKTEDGRKRPDVIVYLPDNKHLIVDSKVSLNAYTQYVNAEEEVERANALQQHATNVMDRINDLSDKNYFNIPDLKSPEMVIMFIPIESAFVEALKADESLFQKAIEKRVLVATPTTLLTSLNIVRQLWRFEDQNRHTAELADKAAKVYEKLNAFLGSMEGIGKSLDKAKDTYDTAFKQLYSGRGNLIKQANEFKALGVSVKTELSAKLSEKAELELQSQSEQIPVLDSA